VTDSTDSALAGLVDAVRDQAEEIAGLDGPRAEAWASDVLALAAEAVDDPHPARALISALGAIGDDRSATALSALRAFVHDVTVPPFAGSEPEWAKVVGTSVCAAGWLVEARGSSSVALRFVDDASVGHVVSIDLVPGTPETVGEVLVGPDDLLDAADEEDAGLTITEAAPAELARRVARALRATAKPRESAVVNGHLLVARLVSLTDEPCEAPIAAVEPIPTPAVRDRADDLHALDVLHRALGRTPDADAVARIAPDAVEAVANAVAPLDLSDLTPAEQDAVLTLEHADWLGAVIGLVRAGEGTAVSGESLVDHVNRCPEVTSTIPKSDRARIVWAFDTVIASWAEIGVETGGRLTDLGVRVLPAALERAWSAAT
jgi:hypothetical protein